VHQPIAGYTHQIEVTGTPRWLVLSGQLGRTLAGTVPTDPIEQLTLALDNLRANLDAAGMEITDLVKLTLYLVGDLDAERRKHALTDRLGGHRPCLTLLFVAGLAAPEYRVEIDAWAAREDYPNSVAGSAATD
jgi:enamine deaminase RidA (YjgF/YER057c/UK114 family)